MEFKDYFIIGSLAILMLGQTIIEDKFKDIELEPLTVGCSCELPTSNLVTVEMLATTEKMSMVATHPDNWHRPPYDSDCWSWDYVHDTWVDCSEAFNWNPTHEDVR